MTKPNYKIKCEKCGIFTDRDKISFNYGRKTCQNCLRKQIITKTYQLYIPTFIVKQQKFKPNQEVKIENTPDGILIIKKS